MEQEDSNHSVLCKMGCGFYGNHSSEGMCSQCYKDHVKRTQQQPTTQGRATPPGAGACGTTSASQLNLQSPTNSSMHTPAVAATPPIDIPRTPEKPAYAQGSSSTPSSPAVVGSADDTPDSTTDSPGKTKKRSRCFSCRKKVGLTGFECRCGGLFCGLHRYSDKHNCTYDYKADGRQQIAKANPVIVGEKIKKL